MKSFKHSMVATLSLLMLSLAFGGCSTLTNPSTLKVHLERAQTGAATVDLERSNSVIASIDTTIELTFRDVHPVLMGDDTWTTATLEGTLKVGRKEDSNTFFGYVKDFFLVAAGYLIKGGAVAP